MLKIKIKSHEDEVTDFYEKKFSPINKEWDSNHTCLAVISLDSALKKGDIYYPQVFLKEYKYIEEKVVRHIHDNLSDFSYCSDEFYEVWIRVSSACVSKNIGNYYQTGNAHKKSVWYF